MGRRGPLPKDPDKLLGHRARGQKPVSEVTAEIVVLPDPKPEWREDTQEAWRNYWRSDLAALAIHTDAPSISRLFGMYDQYARAMEVVARALVVKGSTGQIRTNPLAEHALRLDAAILRLEGELGLTPASRARMGIQIRRPMTQPRNAPTTTESPYAHLRVAK